MKIGFRFFFFLLVSYNVTAQEFYEWRSGICDFMGEIDSSRATILQLDNAYSLLWNTSELSAPFLCTKPSDSVYLKRASIEKECKTLKLELETSDFPKGDFWNTLKINRLRELEENCALRIATCDAFFTSNFTNYTVHSDCKRFKNGLEKGSKSLFKIWEELHKKELSENSDPENIEQIYRKRKASPEIEIWAKIEVLRFGWWNCASDQLFSVQNYQEIETEFKSLVRSLKQNCH